MTKAKLIWTLAGVMLVIATASTIYLLTRPAETQPASQQGTSFANGPFTIQGTMRLTRGQFIWNADPDVCSGYKGFDDIHAGTQVVVTDAEGKTVALGKLDLEVVNRDPSDPSRAKECVFSFEIDAVPAGSAFYGIEVAKRGRVQFERDRLARKVELEIN